MCKSEKWNKLHPNPPPPPPLSSGVWMQKTTCNLRIVNERKLGDSFGKPTFFSNEGCPSTIDCAIISDMYFHQVSSFTVKPQSSLSDHCQIITRIKTPLDIRTTNKSKQTKNNLTKLLPNFHWSSESNVNFKAALNTCMLK